MRITDIIIEKRRNPNLNKKVDKLTALKKYKGQKDIFVSFTSDVGKDSHENTGDMYVTKNVSGAKIGINPNNAYGTPIGIYTYPIDYVLKLHGDVPFASGHPNIFVVQLKPELNYIDAATYTEEDLKNDMSKLHEDELDKHGFNKYEVLTHTARNTALVQTPAGILWNLTRLLASRSVIIAGLNAPDKHVGSAKKDKLKITVLWNKIFQKLGYAGFINYNKEGIIHGNEPTQAIFFSKASFTVIDLIKNITPKTETPSREDIWYENPKAFIKDIMKGIVPDDVWQKLFMYSFYRIKPFIEEHEITLPSKIRDYICDHMSELTRGQDIRYVIRMFNPSDEQLIKLLQDNSDDSDLVFDQHGDFVIDIDRMNSPPILQYIFDHPKKYARQLYKFKFSVEQFKVLLKKYKALMMSTLDFGIKKNPNYKQAVAEVMPELTSLFK